MAKKIKEETSWVEPSEITEEKEQVSKEVDNLNKEIEKLGEEIIKMREEIKNIVHYYQLSSSNSLYLEYVFNASNFTDFIYRLASPLGASIWE